jgi:hypothetical protein
MYKKHTIHIFNTLVSYSNNNSLKIRQNLSAFWVIKNNGKMINWACIAGVGNNPRGVSVFNFEKQGNDYDKNKTYRNLSLMKN